MRRLQTFNGFIDNGKLAQFKKVGLIVAVVVFPVWIFITLNTGKWRDCITPYHHKTSLMYFWLQTKLVRISESAFRNSQSQLVLMPGFTLATTAFTLLPYLVWSILRDAWELPTATNHQSIYFTLICDCYFLFWGGGGITPIFPNFHNDIASHLKHSRCFCGMKYLLLQKV